MSVSSRVSAAVVSHSNPHTSSDLVHPHPAAEPYNFIYSTADGEGEGTPISPTTSKEDRRVTLKVLCKFSCGILGILQVLWGVTSIGLEVVNLTVPEDTYWPLATGLYAGATYALAGMVGVLGLALCKPTRFAVNIFMILSTLSILLALWGIMEGVINLLKATSCCKYNLIIPAQFEAIPISKSVVSFLEFLTALWVSILCHRAGYYDDCCCQSASQAARVNQPEPLYGVGSLYSSSDASSQFKFQVSQGSPTKMLAQSQMYTPGSANATELTDISYLEMEI